MEQIEKIITKLDEAGSLISQLEGKLDPTINSFINMIYQGLRSSYTKEEIVNKPISSGIVFTASGDKSMIENLKGLLPEGATDNYAIGIALQTQATNLRRLAKDREAYTEFKVNNEGRDLLLKISKLYSEISQFLSN